LAILKDYNLERFKLTHLFQGIVNGLDDDFREILQDSLERVETKIVRLAERSEETESIAKAKKYLDSQRAAVAKVLHEVYEEIGKKIEDKAIEIGEAVPKISYNLLLDCTSGEVKKAIQKTFSPIKLSKDRLKRYLESTRIEGLFFNDWLKKLEENAVARIIRETQTGLVLDEPYNKIAKRIQNALNASRHGAEGLARNAVFQAANWADYQHQMEHEERLRGFRFMAELDARTTELCRSLDQQVFPPREAPVPPLHWKCRSYLQPIFKPIKIGDKTIDLEKEIKGKRIVRIESNPRWVNHKDGTRSKIYQDYDVTFVRRDMSYNQMMQTMALSKDPAHRAFAKEALGPTRFDMVASGKLRVESLYYRGKLKTIKELEEML